MASDIQNAPLSSLCKQPIAEPPFSHESLVSSAIKTGGGKYVQWGYWIHFTVEGQGELVLPEQTYVGSKNLWKILLNPTRESLYSVIERSIKALVHSGVSCQGKVIGRDVHRHSSLKVLDDPCEPKFMFYIASKTEEEAKARFLQAMAALQSEFSEDESKILSCPEGERYRDDLKISVPQLGPSFTKMRTPLLFYQQGGYIESQRNVIVESELERMMFGLQDGEETARRTTELLAQFFQGDNFYLYKGTVDPFESAGLTQSLSQPLHSVNADTQVRALDLSSSSLSLQLALGTQKANRPWKESLEEIIELLPDVCSEEELLRRKETILQTMEATVGEFSIDRTDLLRADFVQMVDLRYRIFKKIYALRHWVKHHEKQAPGTSSGLLEACDGFLKNHSVVRWIFDVRQSLKMSGSALSDEVHSINVLMRSSLSTLSQLYPSRNSSVLQHIQWKEGWEKVVHTVFRLGQEFQAVLLDKNICHKQIRWISGSTSASLVPIFRLALRNEPSLTPSRLLIHLNIPPLSGELQNGIQANGVNVSMLSGTDLANREIALCYTRMGECRVENEADLLATVSSEGKSDLVRHKIAALRIATLGDPQEKREALLLHLSDEMQKCPATTASRLGWERYISLLGALLPSEKSQKLPSLIPGTVVGLHRDKGSVIGVVKFNFLTSITVLFGDEGAWGDFSPQSLMIIPEPVLQSMLEESSEGSSAIMEKIEQSMAMIENASRLIRKGSSQPDYTDTWKKYLPLIGRPVPQECCPKRPTLQPGMVVGVPTSSDRYVFGMVVSFDHEQITFALERGQFGKFSRINDSSLLILTDEFLEQEIIKHPQLFDSEVCLRKIREEMKGKKERFQEIIDILKDHPPLEMSEKERGFITNPCPVVFGSLTANPTDGAVSFYGRYEKLLTGRQELGRDIQLIFVDEDRIDDIRAYINSHLPTSKKVHVLSLALLQKEQGN